MTGSRDCTFAPSKPTGGLAWHRKEGIKPTVEGFISLAKREKLKEKAHNTEQKYLHTARNKYRVGGEQVKVAKGTLDRESVTDSTHTYTCTRMHTHKHTESYIYKWC